MMCAFTFGPNGPNTNMLFVFAIQQEPGGMTADEFVEVVRKGKLTDAIRKLNPIKPDGPWFALCDNESFLRKAKATKEVVA